MTSRLIVAVDITKQNEALALIEQLDPSLCALKIGSELFTLWGPNFVKQLVNKGYNVFLDLKFHDIPHTVARACAASAELGVWMLNVHTAGGMQMMQAAVTALEPYGKDKPLLIGVTVLTSFNESTLRTTGITKPLAQHVGELAHLAKNSGLDGVVCSAFEVQAIKKLCGASFITVTPGIRLPHNLSDDQSRIMTPRQAIQEGSDYLVMGRPITRATHPLECVQQIIQDMG